MEEQANEGRGHGRIGVEHAIDNIPHGLLSIRARRAVEIILQTSGGHGDERGLEGYHEQLQPCQLHPLSFSRVLLYGNKKEQQ
jgi:hypothetical protein